MSLQESERAATQKRCYEQRGRESEQEEVMAGKGREEERENSWKMIR